MNVGAVAFDIFSTPSHLTRRGERCVPSTEAGRAIVKKRRYHYDFFYSLKEIIRLGEDLTSRNSSRITQLFCQTRS
ncbi:hypothetical protein G5714_008513 [Onychostoma macrolepis]|uniref:Uncharacterized protein n=1 Tax=Onychostoma macrolepis TaxID=369639 RepID=A0A7J6CYU3_9TELE|nr:hypothetical protein G5714_008513 [Onychostoma macrolepis]